MVESVIHGICICPDPFPLLTSLSFPGGVESRISPPARSFVSHEISTQLCPKGRGFGFALIFPVTLLVRSVLVISLKEHQPLAAMAISGCALSGDCLKRLRCSSLNKISSFLRAASGEWRSRGFLSQFSERVFQSASDS